MVEAHNLSPHSVRVGLGAPCRWVMTNLLAHLTEVFAWLKDTASVPRHGAADSKDGREYRGVPKEIAPPYCALYHPLLYKHDREKECVKPSYDEDEEASADRDDRPRKLGQVRVHRIDASE